MEADSPTVMDSVELIENTTPDEGLSATVTVVTVLIEILAPETDIIGVSVSVIDSMALIE